VSSVSAVYFWLKAPINHKLWPGIILGFIGIVLILHPTKAIFNPGAFIALGGACMLAVAMLALRLLSASDKGHTVLFYYFALGALFTLPLCIIYWVPLTTSSIIQLIILGVLSAIGQYAFVHAFHYAKASQLGPFCYVSVVYAAILDWFLWGSIPDYLAIIGIILVCIGGILTIFFSRPKEQLMKE
jgi:drug/metabolite transporter (DMT)-like permease